jgi:hypothetical protein
MSVPVDLEELTIAELFALSRENPAELAAGLDGDYGKAIRKDAESLTEPVAWSSLRTELAGVMTDALDTKVIDGWVLAWQKCNEVTEKAEMSRSAPDTPFSCILLVHSIESALHPYVKVLLGPKLVQKVDFDVTLTTQIDGIILNLKGGSIVSMQPGRCEWSGSIAVHGAELIKRSLEQLDLPGSLVLKHPIPLAAKRPEGAVT